MKMILAVIPTSYSDPVSKALLEQDFRVTKFASTAGLFSGGTTTLMAVAARANIERALEIIRASIPPADGLDKAGPRATIYVLNVNDLERV